MKKLFAKQINNYLYQFDIIIGDWRCFKIIPSCPWHVMCKGISCIVVLSSYVMIYINWLICFADNPSWETKSYARRRTSTVVQFKNVNSIFKHLLWTHHNQIQHVIPGGGGYFHNLCMHIGYVPRERPPFSALDFRSGAYHFNSQITKKIRSGASPFYICWRILPFRRPSFSKFL